MSHEKPIRITVYAFPWMIRRIEEISKKRKKSKRQVVFEAFTSYIRLYDKGKV